MTAYISQRQCRRRTLGQYLDGAEVDCSSIDGVLCDFCSSIARTAVIEQAVKGGEAGEAGEAEEVEEAGEEAIQ